jgi:hypothetical protein
MPQYALPQTPEDFYGQMIMFYLVEQGGFTKNINYIRRDLDLSVEELEIGLAWLAKHDFLIEPSSNSSQWGVPLSPNS